MREQFTLNLEFAQLHGIPVDNNYTVTPHHSGIYPVDSMLYKFWNEETSIKAASTEAYPYTSPVQLKRGFVFDNILIASRQSASVFSYTLFFEDFGRTIDYWIALYQGGQLFETILYNQVSIFMTHYPNYGNDRLAIFLFENVFQFLSCWTNLKFLSLPALQITEKYFEVYEDEREPLWTVSYV